MNSYLYYQESNIQISTTDPNNPLPEILSKIAICGTVGYLTGLIIDPARRQYWALGGALLGWVLSAVSISN